MVRQKDDMEKKREKRKKNEVLKIYWSFDNKTLSIAGIDEMNL